MSDSDLIRGQVAQILTLTQLVINRGERDGVEPSMYFAVYDEDHPDVVADPSTGESLGLVLRPKLKLRVATVAPRFAIAETFEEKQVNVGGNAVGLATAAVADLFTPPRWITRVEHIETDESTWESLPPIERRVQIGDPVRQIIDPARDVAFVEAT